MLADSVAPLVGNHGTDKFVEAVDGGFIEDALIHHDTHDVSPRPVLLFRGDDGINLTDDFNEFLCDLGLTIARHELTGHLLRVDYLTFTQTFEQLAGFFCAARLVAPSLNQVDVGTSLGRRSLRLRYAQNVLYGYGFNTCQRRLHLAQNVIRNNACLTLPPT